MSNKRNIQRTNRFSKDLKKLDINTQKEAYKISLLLSDDPFNSNLNFKHFEDGSDLLNITLNPGIGASKFNKWNQDFNVGVGVGVAGEVSNFSSKDNSAFYTKGLVGYGWGGKLKYDMGITAPVPLITFDILANKFYLPK